MTGPPDSERVLILTPVGRDAALVAEMLHKGGLTGEICARGSTLADEIGRGAGAVLLGEEALSADTLDALRPVLAEQPPWSDIPLVVLTRRPSQGPSAQLDALCTIANVTLLDRPVRARIVLSAVKAALRTRRRQYEAKRAIVQRDNFLAMLGHELRNPLGAISLSSEVLGRRGNIEAPLRRHLDVIGRQVAHLSRLVDDLLDVSRITSGKILLQTEPVDLSRLIERALETAAQVTGRIDVDLPREPLWVSGDPVRLEQVMVNLIGNAIKYTPAPGRVRVALERSDDEEAVVDVIDEGIGIARNVLPYIFDLFTQADVAPDRVRSGLGIGLTVVRGLAELHGGRVEARSAGVGRGSAFTVRLPLARAQTITTVGPSKPVPLQPRHVLLIEDSDDIRDVLREFLEGEGHRVEAANDGATGLRALVATQPDVAIVDIGLPGLDGFAVARAVRRDVGSRVRLIALSGYGQPGDKVKAQEAGFDAHLTKPVDLDVLLRMLAS